MPGTLPPVLPGSSSPSSAPKISAGGWGRAQDLSTAKLDQYKERDQARVSIGQVISGSTGNQKSTSVFHPGGAPEDAALTSITHAGEARTSINRPDEAQEQERADQRRYGFMRRMIKQRQQEEADSSGLKAGTGSAFTKKGFTKKLRHLVLSDKDKYKNISQKDRAYFGSLVERHAKTKSTGAGYSVGDKKRMRLQIGRDARAGKISREDAKDFKNIVDTMK
ncbi:MAG: hypothetical protein COU35_03415 [Candidatus Magasanikbacteria bacterium CG10_big_fil_rev_8_21_14_0_10_47_10]|uniref:Uncharacterized protein n=1 Tax=Candidatus Magasanikbacteria bacterium CG10_big_fil_rev_8_21_14_0_10_47_10 TaxID=1974652 RepID=A0A2H0TS12_9BACT|nr:MAG: hypothetical protein COU35_03415 [Candidatus Magasanikbacteria bacterium CG10_big_fil_rev_8_21_14_0_10_47_10]